MQTDYIASNYRLVLPAVTAYSGTCTMIVLGQHHAASGSSTETKHDFRSGNVGRGCALVVCLVEIPQDGGYLLLKLTCIGEGCLEVRQAVSLLVRHEVTQLLILLTFLQHGRGTGAR